jgi:hypothetical protein
MEKKERKWKRREKREEKEREKERKKGRGEGGTDEVPCSTPGRSYFCLAFCRSTPTLIAPKNDDVSYNGALELKR